MHTCIRRTLLLSGVGIYEGIRVEGVDVEGGRVTGVRTNKGNITCEIFVNCAGQVYTKTVLYYTIGFTMVLSVTLFMVCFFLSPIPRHSYMISKWANGKSNIVLRHFPAFQCCMLPVDEAIFFATFGKA